MKLKFSETCSENPAGWGEGLLTGMYLDVLPRIAHVTMISP